MKYRYLASKTFNSGVTTKTGAFNGLQMYTEVISRYGKTASNDYAIEITKGMPDVVNNNSSVSVVKDYVKSDELLRSIMLTPTGDVIPLCEQFNSNGALDKVLADESYIHELRSIAEDMFRGFDSRTDKSDIERDAYYTHLIPLVSLTGVIPPQLNSEKEPFFNPNGTVTMAEFLDSLNAIKTNSNSTVGRKISEDSCVSDEDFFNVGYNACVSGLSSPFYNQYTRRELMQPITRLELAYVVVLCWGDYIKKFGNVYGGNYTCGLNVNWDAPARNLNKFEDGFKYTVCKRVYADNPEVASLKLEEYRGDDSVTDFISKVKTGEKGVPYPMFMSLLELDAVGLYHFDGNKLNPTALVSRGEWCYFVVRLAELFRS